MITKGLKEQLKIKEETFKGFIYMTLTQISGVLTHFFIQYLLIILFPPEEFAYYSFALTFYTFFSLLATFGLGATIVQHLSSLKDENSEEIVKLITEGFKLVWLLNLIVSLILFFTSDLFEQIYEMPGLGLILKYTSLYLFFSTLIRYFSNTFRGLRNFKYYMFSNVLLNSLQLIIICLNFILRSPIYLIFAQYSFASFIEFVIILAIQIKSKNLSSFFIFNRKVTKKLLKFAIFIFPPILFVFLSTGFNQFILAYYIEPVELAYYIIIIMALQILSMPVLIFTQLLHPYISYYMQREGPERKNIDLIYNSIIKYGLLIMVPLSLYVSFFSEYLIVSLLSVDYYPVSIYLKVFVFYINIKILEVTGNLFLLASNEQKIIFKLCALNALFCLILSLILIPIYYIYGALLAIVIPHSIMIIYSTWLVKKKNNITLKLRVIFSLFKFIFSSIFSISFLFLIILILNINLYNFVLLVLFSGIYFGVFLTLIILSQAISIDEIKDFFKVLKSSVFTRNKSKEI
ncbi:MAG: oligosaccharide flippase family protein [Promethearchaeota archaeon]